MRLHFSGDLGDGFKLGIIAARLDKFLALERARGHSRFKLGEAIGDLLEAFWGDLHVVLAVLPAPCNVNC